MTDDVRQVRRAQVWKRGRLAGCLERTPEGVRFSYVDDYSGPAVATTLPIDGEPVQRPGGALPAYFTGLLPEGRRLGALRRAVKTSADDELSLLLVVGADTIGDVQVLPAGVPPGAVTPRVVIDPAASLHFGQLLRDLDLHPERVALPGVQDKASAAMFNVPVSRAGERLLLKVEPPEYPGLVGNEAFFLRAGARSGLETAGAEVVRDSAGVAGLLVTRFDRVTVQGSPVSLAVEDACQALGRAPGDKYLIGYAAGFDALSSTCDARLLAVRTLLAQLAFAYVTGNGDAHGKNFSIVQRPDGEWRVSPAYDVPSSQPYGDTTTAMPINGRRTDLGARDLAALGTELGLPDRASQRVLRDVTSRADSWLPELEELPFDAQRVRTLCRVVQQRCRRLSP